MVWVGTGEGNPRNSVNMGGGIFKSIDGGLTWKAMGLEKTINIHRIIIDPMNPDVVYAGVIGFPFGDIRSAGSLKPPTAVRPGKRFCIRTKNPAWPKW